jgi:hypothetical protein
LGHWQRADREGGLAVNVERLAAGGEHGDERRPEEDRPGQLRAGVDEVLARVEDEQQAAVAEVREERVPLRGLGLVGQPEPAGDRVRHQLGVALRGQLDQAGPVRVPGSGRLGGAQGDAGLADPAGPNQRYQPRVANEFVDLTELRCPPDELIRFRRELT